MVVVWVGLSFLLPAGAQAQEWYDLYEKGLNSLQKKQALIAAGFFERAIRRQPTPGENLLTYGTNRLSTYYPYLRLAEALAMAGDFDRARSALERSEASKREPAAQRMAVMKLLTAQTAPPPAVVPAPPVAPTQMAPAPSAQEVAPPASTRATPALEPPPAPVVTPKAGVSEIATPAQTTTLGPKPVVAPSARAIAASPTPAPPAEGAGLVASSSPEATASVLQLTTNPGGADVYLDGEFIGRSDASGRLVRRGVSPGSHEIRVGGVAGFLERRDVVQIAGATFERIVLLDRQAVTEVAAAGGLSPAILLGGISLILVLSIAGFKMAKGRTEVASSASFRTQLAQTQLTANPPWTAGTLTRGPDTPTATLSVAPATPTGSTFGDYEILEQLGKGGMAVVYRARRRGEEMALKRPLAAFVEQKEFVERFVREAEIGRTLNHPNIIRIFDKGRVGDMPYFTMELVDGETLHARARREGALGPDVACQLVKQVAEALDYSHLKGVIHRDLKPSNIMILKSGTVKVMDYGIARSTRLEALTATGAFLGTPEYVAPETAEGGRTDAQSDLYSLGVVFYEILTGVRPFTGDTPFATLKKICSDPPTPPSAVRNCPPELEAIVLRLLQKKPAARHASAEELLNDLKDYLNRAA
jgi:predicted Ser/Thr protein kinase